MKKMFSFVLVALLFMFLPSVNNASATYKFEIEEEISRIHDGTSTLTINGIMTYDDGVNTTEGPTKRQRIHFLEFDNYDEDIHLVVIDDFPAFGYSAQTMLGMIMAYESKNPHLEVIGAVNGDFFDINNTKRPSSTHILNYEVINGVSGSRPVFTVRADGTASIEAQRTDGHEILIKNEDNEIILREKVNFVNKANPGQNEIGIYTPRFEGEFPSDNVALMTATSMRHSGDNLQNAKGVISEEQDFSELGPYQFALYGSRLMELVEQGYEVLVQVKMQNFEDVQSAIGGNVMLVTDGVPTNHEDRYSHPRTTVGIRADGSVFFMVAEGRDKVEDIPGIRYGEMGQLLASYGAQNALNLDGGGSSTMIVKNTDGEFEVINKLSDGSIRSVANGILIVRGDIDLKPVEILGGDNRTSTFNAPTNLYIDSYNFVRFDEVPGAERYIVEIDGIDYETSKTYFNLNNFIPKEYEINVRVRGTNEVKPSNRTETIRYEMQTLEIQKMIEYLREYAKNIN